MNYCEKYNSIHPSKKLKIFFWIILGALSVFFAEVVSGSDLFPFFHLWGLLVVFPLYTLHILVLSYVVFNYGKPWFCTLFIAGAIFGMYEAYITKVLWNPPWGAPLVSLAGIAVIEVVVLALFWHPFMAFIIPLFVGENMLTNSRKIAKGLPNRIKRLFNTRKKSYILLVLFAVLLGIFQSANSFSPLHSLLSAFSTTAVLVLLICLWRNKTKGKEYDIQALLPNKGEFLVLLTLLIVMYVVMGIFVRLEALPGFVPQLIIWLMYAGLFILLVLSLRKSRKIILSETIGSPMEFSWKTFVILSLFFAVSSAVSKFLLGSFRGIIILMVWLIGGIIGILILFLAIRDLFRGIKAS